MIPQPSEELLATWDELKRQARTTEDAAEYEVLTAQLVAVEDCFWSTVR